MVLIAAVLASAMGFIDSTVIAIAIPSMRDTLGASLPQAQWISNAYMLTLSAFILVGGAFGDRFGLARMFSLGIVGFVLASMACAFAPSPEFLVAARFFQGIGAALMVPGSMAIVARAYPRAERARAIGTWAAAASVSTALGPIIGGLALTFGGAEMWRWIFAINLPFAAIALWLLWRAIERDAGRPGEQIDFIGAALAVIGLGLLAFGLTGAEGGGEIRLAPCIAGAAILALFVWVEARISAPMLDLGLFRDRTFAVVNLAIFLHWLGFIGVIFFLPVVLVGAWGLTEITASLALAPLSVFVGLLSRRTSGLAERYGPRLVLGFGMSIVAISFFLLGAVAPRLDFWWGVLPAMIGIGFGMSFVAAPLSATVMTAIDEQHSGTASGINNAVSRIGGLISIAALGSLAASRYHSAGGTASFAQHSAPPSEVLASTAGLVTISWIAAGCAALAAALCLVTLPGRQPPAQ
ncbi:hypothetical protein AIOL_002849 [Candidatus Rhodobacter oscarellae]|uniref:Major facilitator superfamily (MFS) profile domain-containing protein n=1 Tax=Candidatus Rhodobacter oscarellae TaxID=1675527 RepID=A0A0J9E583_9RHOB|nr:MFS transporter [Candidatus Rhodobacter lobularis]KMW57881.1 hypothetical protein AIOL_002849 [Candidatus Rhodobacter lobularis]